MKSFTMKECAPVVLRIGIALVFLWFGSQQLIHTSKWESVVPQSIIDISQISATTLVHFNGAFEIVFGICLLFGFFTSISALLLALHMLEITFVVGYGATGVRDFGISIATIAVALYGTTRWSVDAAIAEQPQSQE